MRSFARPCRHDGRDCRSGRRAPIGWVAAGLALSLAVAGCDSPSPAQPSPTPSSTAPVGAPIVANTRSLADGVLPADAEDPDTARVAGLLFRGLMRYDAKGKAVKEVAESIDTTDDRVFTVKIASGWRFSDGSPVTSASFVDAWSFAARGSSNQYRAGAFEAIVGYQAVRKKPGEPGYFADLGGLSVLDSQTFTITLVEPRPGFRDSLADPAFAPLPASAFANPAAFARSPIGNGPYALDGTWNRGELRLRANPVYTGSDTARNAGLVLRAYADLDTAYGDLLAGRLDVLDTIPVGKLAASRTDLGARAVNQPVGRAQSIVIPMHRSEWQGASGLARRTAISTAIDRSKIATTLLAGTRLPATDLAAPVVEGSSQSMCAELCRHDDTAAKESLADAGGLPRPLEIAYAADAGDRPWLDAVCADIAGSLGVSCTPKRYPSLTLLRAAVAAGEETGPYVDTWQMSEPTLSAFLVPRFVSGAPQNLGGYTNEVIDTQLGTAATAPQGAQAAAYQKIEELILDDLPVIPLWSVNATMGSAPGVQDVRSDVFGAPVFTEISRQ